MFVVSRKLNTEVSIQRDSKVKWDTNYKCKLGNTSLVTNPFYNLRRMWVRKETCHPEAPHSYISRVQKHKRWGTNGVQTLLLNERVKLGIEWDLGQMSKRGLLILTPIFFMILISQSPTSPKSCMDK